MTSDRSDGGNGDGLEAALERALIEASDSARARDAGGVRARIDRVEGRLDELDDDELAARLRHGCDAVRRLVADEPLVAAEYIDAMRRRVGGE
jgi:hypothetical protein